MNKSAREMFEELGWREYFKSSVMITYEKNSRSGKSSKYIQFFFDKKEFYIGSEGNFNQPFTMKELQAINQQCKELRWLDEL